MAGGQFTWKQALSAAVASNISDVMAPLEQLFTVEYIGVGEDGIKVPTASGGLAMNAVTKGTPATNDSNYNFTGVTYTPTPRALSVPIAKRDLENASPAQVEDLILAFSEAAHQEIINDIQTAVAALTPTVGTGAADTLDAATLRSAKWKIKKNKGPGQIRAVVASDSMEEFETNLESLNLRATLTQQVVSGAEMYEYAGMLIYPDVYLGGDGAGPPEIKYNFACTQRGLRIVYGGLEPDIVVLPTTDPINVRLAMGMWLKAGIPNENLACWIKTGGT